MRRMLGALCAAILISIFSPAEQCSAQRPQAGPQRPTAAQPPPRRAPPRNAPQGPPQRGAANPAVVRGPAPPPFVLNPAQQRELDVVLAAWEQRSAAVKTLSAKFDKWEYNNVFPDENGKPVPGELYFAAPDKGAYKVNGQQKEHWVCDGESIYEHDYDKKHVIERPLPDHLKGKAITNGPLPFLFGAEAERLKARYYLRIVTPPDERETQIWIEAIPRHFDDLVNMSRALLILMREDMLPNAIRVFDANGNSHTDHVFSEKRVNRPLDVVRQYFKHHWSGGWKKIVEEPPPIADVPAGPSRVTPPGRTGATRRGLIRR